MSTGFFGDIQKVKYEGPDSTNPLAFRYYQPDEIVLGKRAITADTALRLAHFFRTSEQFWMALQASFDLEEARKKLGSRLKQLERAAA